jgi:hypothetical protein
VYALIPSPSPVSATARRAPPVATTAFPHPDRLEAEAPAAPAPVAPPPVEVWPEADPGWEARKGAAALERIAFPFQQLGFEIRFLPAKAGHKAGMFPHEKVIEVWVRPELTVSELAFDIAHELGHALDWTRFDDARRQAFRELRGYPQNPSWFTCSGCNDFSTPAGDLAETFAYAMVGPVTFRSQLGPAPTPEQVEVARSLFTF